MDKIFNLLIPKTKRDMYEALVNSSDDEENRNNSTSSPIRHNLDSDQVKILDESNNRSLTPTSIRSKTKIV
jgi:hypothetical protein